jgi:hypothetical protein
MNLKYQINKNSIYFGKGNRHIKVDCKNNVYTNLVEFLNSIDSQNKIYINLKSNYKLYLILLKSIFYSNISRSNLYLINANQIHKHILSKVFCNNVFLKNEKNLKKIYIQKYQFDNKKVNFEYKYSIIFISAKLNIDFVKKIISEFSNFNIEFLFVINEEVQHKFTQSNIKIIYYKSDHDLRFNISKKKNLGMRSASGEILIVTHDRIQITAEWLNGLSSFSNSFDLYTSKIISKNYRFLDKLAYRFEEYLFLKPRLYYLLYNENNSFQYPDGGIIVLNNKRFFGQKIFDESLKWLEMEDVDFAARTKLDCNLISFDKNNQLLSDFKNHFKLSKNPLMYFYKSFIRRFINPF